MPTSPLEMFSFSISLEQVMLGIVPNYGIEFGICKILEHFESN